jgi:DNA-binding NarL/FixJ family response regulator
LVQEENIFTVLIVDHDDSFRTTLCAHLKQDASFDVFVEAASASEAIVRARHFVPILAILDSSLPGMNGLQLAQELGKILHRVSIFLLTADHDLRVEKEALSCGIDAVFSKIDELEAVVANAAAVCENWRHGGPR